MISVIPQLPEYYSDQIFLKRIKKIDLSFRNYLEIKYPDSTSNRIIEEEDCVLRTNVEGWEEFYKDIVSTGYFSVMTLEESEASIEKAIEKEMEKEKRKILYDESKK